MEEKKECKGCLYSDYDYDGKEVYFLGCRKLSKCKGAVIPKERNVEVEHNGIKFHIHQAEWLSYTGKTVNLCVLKQDGKGEFHECLHAGHYGKFLKEEEIPQLLDFMESLKEVKRTYKEEKR